MNPPTRSAETISSAVVTLNNGITMPWLGLGVWRVDSDAEAERVVGTAIEKGYRSIDTAKIYENERGVGRAIRHGGIPRGELFVTTKVWNDDVRADNVLGAFDESLKRLGLDYVDLYLVHWPVRGKIVSAWRAMEKLARTGRVRAIGVSNHLQPHLDELLPVAETVPAVNQIEFHPRLQSRPLVEFCRARHIQVEAWSPLMKAGALLKEPTLEKIARRHGKTVAQVILRWERQHDVVTIPKSVHASRLAENAAIFGFSLDAAEMSAIDTLDQQERVGADPMSFPF